MESVQKYSGKKNVVLERLLVAYGHLPHHPGKGMIYDRLFPLVESSWEAPRIRTRFGVRFECDLTDKVTREIYYTGFDRKDCRILKRLVKPGDVILDAGANVGYFSLLCARWMRAKGVVHAFEPFPQTVRKFERNLELNPGLQPVVHLHRAALSNFIGTMGMCVPDQRNQGCNFLSSTGGLNVDVTTLDSFCENGQLSRIDLIKIDVEGSEVALLQGAEQVLRRFRPVLMIEANPCALKNFGNAPLDLIQAITRHGYRLSYAGRFGLKPLLRLPTYGEEPNVFAFPIN